MQGNRIRLVSHELLLTYPQSRGHFPVSPQPRVFESLLEIPSVVTERYLRGDAPAPRLGLLASHASPSGLIFLSEVAAPAIPLEDLGGGQLRRFLCPRTPVLQAWSREKPCQCPVLSGKTFSLLSTFCHSLWLPILLLREVL